MDYNRYVEGSTWGRWDFQVQPIKNEWFSKLDQSAIQEKVKKSTNEYIKQAAERGLDVVAITDHNSGAAIDYAMANNYGIKIIPGVELDTQEAWHLLVLFDPEYKERVGAKNWGELVDSFLDRTCKVNRPFVTPGKNTFEKIRVTTIELLREIKVNKVGLAVFAHCLASKSGFFKTSDADGRSKILDSYLKGKINFGFEVKSNYHKVTDQIEKWYPNKNISIPIVSSSDAHSAKDVGTTFSWVKANPTFEGLKQVFHEPSSRISELEPKRKSKLNIINRIRFRITDKNLKNEFSEEWIYLNENLNSIIGGKSTGKSLLLHFIAKTVDENQVKNRQLNNYDKFKDIDFELEWADHDAEKNPAIYTLKNFKSDKRRRITYIPQLFIDKLAHDEKKRDELIQDVLGNLDNYKEFKETFIHRKMNISSSLNKKIEDLLEKNKLVKSKDIALRELGDKEGIEFEILNLKNQIDDIKNNTNLSPEERSRFDSLQLRRKQIQDEINEKDKIQKQSDNYIKLISSDLDNLLRKLNDELKRLQNILNSESILPFSKINENFELKIKEFKKELNNKLSKTGKFDAEINSLNQELDVINQGLKSYETKISNKGKLLNLQDKLSNNEEDLKLIQQAEKELQFSQQDLTLTKREILKTSNDLHNCYLEFSTKMKQNYSVLVQDGEKTIKLNTNVRFSFQKFADNFIELFNHRTSETPNKKYAEFFNKSDTKKYEYEEERHQSFTEKCFQELLEDEKFAYKGAQSSDQAIKNLFEDYYDLSYTLKQGEDIISEMSPGKRALMLLKLIFSLQNQEFPILIDQPEENLDNRTIYTELKEFIKDTKNRRQIIQVTHNANLVVNTDSEQIIVANQAGLDGKDNKKHQFEYVFGALEHTIPYNDNEKGVLYQQGIKEHICDILEGGEEAFKKREQKYNF